MNVDWINAEPLLHWLYKRKKFAVIGPFLSERWVAFGMSWAGLVLDTFISPLLLYRPLLFFGSMFAIAFHLMNKMIFSIGIFPWVMLASHTIFFDHDWPIQVECTNHFFPLNLHRFYVSFEHLKETEIRRVNQKFTVKIRR